MNNERDWPAFLTQPAEELIASFGDAQLYRHSDGTIELRGGSPQERAEAQHWLGQCHPASVVRPQS